MWALRIDKVLKKDYIDDASDSKIHVNKRKFIKYSIHWADWFTSQKRIFQLKSLIMAQIERWRQA